MENIISRAPVKALKLNTEKHPQLYKVGWIRRGIELNVIEDCRVPLSIGKSYQDEVTCDMLDIDTSHGTLGRPWKFDQNVIHKGQESFYSFVWKGRKIMLLPLVPELPIPLSPAAKPEPLLTVNATKFNQAIKESRFLIALLIEEEGGVNEELPDEIQHLLTSYEDVISIDLLQELLL